MKRSYAIWLLTLITFSSICYAENAKDLSDVAALGMDMADYVKGMMKLVILFSGISFLCTAISDTRKYYRKQRHVHVSRLIVLYSVSFALLGLFFLPEVKLHDIKKPSLIEQVISSEGG